VTDDFEGVLFTEQQIEERVKALGARITRDYAGKTLLLVGVLKGSFMFLADIARKICLSCEIRFLSASSYGHSSVSSGDIKIGKGIDFEITGRDVILIEDILDTGETLAALREFLSEYKPASLKLCAMLDKPSRRKAPVIADYVGFECPDKFVVGYGLDYAERYRNLPYIASLKPEVYLH
jgi:hypoxanthine phosphoribosyltransferase